MIQMWKVNWSTWHERGTKKKKKRKKERKNLRPNQNRTHDLGLNTRRVLHPLSYKNSWRAGSFNWVHVWQASNTCIVSHFWQICILFSLVVRAKGHIQTKETESRLTNIFCHFFCLVHEASCTMKQPWMDLDGPGEQAYIWQILFFLIYNFFYTTY